MTKHITLPLVAAAPIGECNDATTIVRGLFGAYGGSDCTGFMTLLAPGVAQKGWEQRGKRCPFAHRDAAIPGMHSADA
jgi:hypothetical protein